MNDLETVERACVKAGMGILALQRIAEVVKAARAREFARRNPYQLNMPACEKRLEEALVNLDKEGE